MPHRAGTAVPLNQSVAYKFERSLLPHSQYHKQPARKTALILLMDINTRASDIHYVINGQKSI
jgi:hypothetical protein